MSRTIPVHSASRGARLLGIAVALAAATALGYLVGGPYGRDATRRGVEIQELTIGALGAPIELGLPELAAGPVRNVVLMIGDGMGVAQIEAARLAAFGPEGRFVFERFPATGLAATHASGAPVTDSAASATAIATGVATSEDRIATAPDGRPLLTLLEAGRDAGFVTGLVTTSSIADATPAAFAAHADSRDEVGAIALQVAGARVDLLIGGGREQFEPSSAGGGRRDGRNLLAEAKERGVAIAATAEELAAARGLPLWALVPGRPDKSGPAPPLADWTERALTLVAEEARRRGRGFFLLIEEEGIDTAAHGNRLESLARSLLRFDAAVAAAARFAAGDGATLLVVAGDHTTGGLSIDRTTDAERLRVAWASAHHGSEPVPVYAYGPADAAARFTGYYHQREIGRRLAALAGLDLSGNWEDAP